MSKRYSVNVAVRVAILGATIPLTIASGIAQAQENAAGDLAEVIVTGTRITAPGVTSSSPILSVTAADIAPPPTSISSSSRKSKRSSARCRSRCPRTVRT